jgi:hypothetical protein
MEVKDLIRELKTYSLGKKIEIECPNGLLVNPKIKVIHLRQWDMGSPIISYVITWQD